MGGLTPRLIDAPLLVGLCHLAGGRLIADDGKLVYFPAPGATTRCRTLLEGVWIHATRLKPDVFLLLSRPVSEREALISAALLREGFWYPRDQCQFFIGSLGVVKCRRCGRPPSEHYMQRRGGGTCNVSADRS